MKRQILFSIALASSLVYAQNANSKAEESQPSSEVQEESGVADTTAQADSAKAPEQDSLQQALVVVPPPPQETLAEGTPLKGTLHGFLKADQSPYLITEDISVAEDMVLVVEPGVVLQFAPGTGLYVKGQFVVAGTRGNEVVFQSALGMPKSGDWKGIFITGDQTSEIRNAVIKDAATGVVVENGALKIHASKIEKTSSRGVYARNSKLTISETQFNKNDGAAVHVDSYSEANISSVHFDGNNVALYNGKLAITQVESSRFENNSYGILDMANSYLAFDNSQVSKNKVGASIDDVLEKEVLESIAGNETDYSKDFNDVSQMLPREPEIPGVESRPIGANDKVGDLLAQKKASEEEADSTQKGWSIYGNVMFDSYYHRVITSKNDTDEDVEVNGSVIKPGEKFNNIFQTPGFGTEANIYLLMQSFDGKTIEFSTNYTGDSWDHFSPNQVTLSYTDNYSHLILGDFNKAGGNIYMEGLPVFGVGYTLSLLKNNANQPLVELDGFFGENRKPYLKGDRHPEIYKDYIEDGETRAQRLTYGGSFKWAPLRRFDAKFGFIYANDEIEDPLFRDGSTHSSLTSEPMQKSLTAYADGNWLFYPGDIELNGQIAVGHADTADVYRERAINKVFTDAGLNTSSMSKLRQLMANESRINSLSSKELEEIFGDNTTLSRSAMRDSLRTLIREAKSLKNDYEDERDEDRVFGLNWGSQDIALGGSLYWNIYKTTLSGHVKYVGANYYSAGSPDQLSNTREFGGNIEQIVTDFWTLNFGYQINVENAAKEEKTNILGLSEGTEWGLFGGDDTQWFDDHERDEYRTKYIQNWKLQNEFKLNKAVSIDVGYNLEYRTQYRPYQLHGNYILEDGIYKDGWFEARKGNPTTEIVSNGDTTLVDSARWTEYLALSSEDNLASKFQERIYRNSWSAGISVQAYRSIFRLGGRWTIRTDDSKFYKDSLISDMDLSNETIAKLGYYFGGADFFEHSYPLSITTNLGTIQNSLAVTPRFKSYERDDMTESEITVDEDFEIAFMKRFLTVGLSGEFRYMVTSWEEEGGSFDEKETDILGTLNLTVNHTKRLSSEWYGGTALYFRPDNLSDEYKDIFGGIRVNYAF